MIENINSAGKSLWRVFLLHSTLMVLSDCSYDLAKPLLLIFLLFSFSSITTLTTFPHFFCNPWLQYFHWNTGGHDSTLLSWGYCTFEALIAGRPINLWRKNKLNKKIAKPGFESAPAGWAGGPGTTHALIHHLPTRGRQYKVKRDGNANTQRQRQRNKYRRIL